MSSPSSPTVRTGAPFGRSASIAALTVLFPARRGTAMTRNDRRARAASRSVDAIGRGIVPFSTRALRSIVSAMAGWYGGWHTDCLSAGP